MCSHPLLQVIRKRKPDLMCFFHPMQESNQATAEALAESAEFMSIPDDGRITSCSSNEGHSLLELPTSVPSDVVRSVSACLRHLCDYRKCMICAAGRLLK